ncbi:unnamed protein product [Caenorhabditis auriculariae]|uniref:ShKT domain-containing protein n=1 Tax=Caenorhabditis auriculariae TaxID=2777116 RepID=A0A8S1HJK3_9PELO|nr:unnamed protein product [Caenorhabditis auriculariae]
MKLFASLLLCALSYVYAQYCCQGSPLGICVNGMCPNGTMCNGGVCCPGCFDTCYDCYLYLQYCNNPYYACAMSGCQASCGKCHP